MFDYTMDFETLEAIHAAEILKEFCGYIACDTCPFYTSIRRDDTDCAGCMFGNNIPAYWNVPERK